jgi:hypothetical protein
MDVCHRYFLPGASLEPTVIIIIIKGLRQRHTEGAEAQLQQFLTSALDRTGSQLHALATLFPVPVEKKS